MRMLLCLLALVAVPAWAEWEKVSESDDTTFYIDPATVRKSGNFRKVWRMQDRKQLDKRGVMSRRMLTEYDCKEARDRTLSHSAHSEPMGKGSVLVAGQGSATWDFVPPDTPAADTLKRVCAK